MSNKADRTKKHIQTVYFEWMKEVGLDRITIAGLAKKAGINRGTFYLYYVDKYAVLEEVEQVLYQELAELMDTYFYSKLSALGKLDKEFINRKFFDSSLHLMQFFFKNKEIFSVLLGSNGDPYFIQKIEKLYTDTVHNKRTVLATFDSQYVHYQLEFIFAGIISAIKCWLRTGSKETPEEMSKILLRCMHMEPMKFVENWDQGHFSRLAPPPESREQKYHF